MRWAPAIALLLAAVAPAHADDKPEPRWYPHVSAGAGIGFWIGDVGALTPTGATLEVQADVAIGRMFQLRVLGEHAFLTARDDILARPLGLSFDGVALLLHHAIFGFGAQEIRIGGDMHVLAGVEREWMRWDDGTRLARNEIVAGFGGTVVVYDRAKRHPEQQIDYGLRMLFSRAPDAGKLPFGCDGPCDMATQTAPFDRTVIMEVAWRYGR